MSQIRPKVNSLNLRFSLFAHCLFCGNRWMVFQCFCTPRCLRLELFLFRGEAFHGRVETWDILKKHMF